MGTCCGSARPGNFQFIYSILADGRSIFEYCITTDQFSQYQLPLQLPAMCKYCEILSDKLLIVGGFERLKTKLGQSLASVYIFSKDSGIIPAKNLEKPRSGHCLISFQNTAFLISGVISQIQPTTSCLKFEYFSNNWSEIAPINKARVLAAGCCVLSFLYITGGNSGTSLQNFRDIEQYDIINDTWNLCIVKLPMDIWRHTCLPYKSGLIIFGGNGNRSYNLDCYKIDLELNIITQQTWMLQGGEFSGCNASINQSVYAFETSQSKLVWIFSQNKWTPKLRKSVKVFKYDSTL